MDIIQIPTGNSSSEDSYLYNDEFIIATMTIYGVFSFVGTGANLFVIGMIICCKKLRTMFNVFILNVAIGDLVILVFCMPFTVTAAYFWKNWIYGRYVCYMVKVAGCAGPTITVLFLAVLAYERYVAVCHPLQVKQWGKWRVISISAAIYVAAFARSILRPLFEKVYDEKWNVDTKTMAYICNDGFASSFVIWFNAIGVGLFYILVFAVMIFFCTRISTTLRSSRHLTRNNAKADESRMKVVRMVIIMAIAFAVSWSMVNSLAVMFTIPTLNHIMTKKWFTVYLFISRIFEYSNCVFNPIIYVTLSGNFRKACTDVFCGKSKRHSAAAYDQCTSGTALSIDTDVSSRPLHE